MPSTPYDELARVVARKQPTEHTTSSSTTTVVALLPGAVHLSSSTSNRAESACGHAIGWAAGVCGVAWRQTSDVAIAAAHSSQLTAHSSQLTAHSSRLTAHSSQLTAHSSQLTAHGSQLTAHGTQLTAHGSQLTAHGTQLTAHGSQLTAHRANGSGSLTKWIEPPTRLSTKFTTCS